MPAGNWISWCFNLRMNNLSIPRSGSFSFVALLIESNLIFPRRDMEWVNRSIRSFDPGFEHFNCLWQAFVLVFPSLPQQSIVHTLFVGKCQRVEVFKTEVPFSAVFKINRTSTILSSVSSSIITWTLSPGFLPIALRTSRVIASQWQSPPIFTSDPCRCIRQ